MMINLVNIARFKKLGDNILRDIDDMTLEQVDNIDLLTLESRNKTIPPRRFNVIEYALIKKKRGENSGD